MQKRLAYFVGVTTAPRNPPTLAASLASIRRAGWEPDLISNDANKTLGPYQNLLRILRAAVQASDEMQASTQSHIDYALVFQDDIEIAANLREYVDRGKVIIPPTPTSSRGANSVISFYTPANLHHDVTGWHPTERLPRSYGALAIMMPMQTARLFTENPPGATRQCQADFWITKFCKVNNIPYWTHSPSFVRHTGTISSLSAPNINTELRQCKEFAHTCS